MTTRTCVAPQVAMVFEPYGNVQACCANALYPLGNIADMTLREIWEGERANELRAALARGDFGFGCSVCRHRLEYSGGGMPIDLYDLYPLDDASATPTWPTLLSFSLHNTCNLECIMCGGDASSKIRTHRDGLPGLPHAYGEPFFKQIEPFIEHCTHVDFVGGEPFLVREHARIWELVLRRPGEIAVSVTTNGTVWNDNVERWLGAQDTSIFMSIDGVTAETFERVRVGASYREVMSNLDRFQAYTQARGTNLILSWSLVRANWHEFPDMMRWAESRGLPVHVQTVIEPEHGVQRLPTPELRTVVTRFEQADLDLRDRLDINRDIWTRELERLRVELNSRGTPQQAPLIMEPPSEQTTQHIVDAISRWNDARPRRLKLSARRHQTSLRIDAEADLRQWARDRPVGYVEFDQHLRVISADVVEVFPEAPALGTNRLSLRQFLDELATSTSSAVWLTEEFPGLDQFDLGLFLGSPTRDKRGIVVRAVATRSGRGLRLAVACDRFLATPTRRSAASAAVSLGPAPRSFALTEISVTLGDPAA